MYPDKAEIASPIKQQSPVKQQSPEMPTRPLVKEPLPGYSIEDDTARVSAKPRQDSRELRELLAMGFSRDQALQALIK